MAAKTDIELALANLEAGKFSFRMVETIKDHISTLETDLALAKSESESAAKTLLEREFTIARLEAELRKVNAKVHALVKANALTEAAMRESARGAVMLREAGAVAGEQAVALSKKTVAWLSSVDVKAEVEKAKAHPLTVKAQARLAAFDLQAEWKKLQAHPLTEKALREFETALGKAQDYLPVARKQFAALVEKAQAFIANLNKKAA
jgi:uncharacterized protein YhbP (UPF0306 family)